MKLSTSALFLLLALSQKLHAQSKLSAERGVISFASNAELELIKAYSDRVRGIINTGNNQFAFIVDVRTFVGFNSGLQREHFLEKYMEVDKFPTAEFSGKLIEKLDFKEDGVYEVRAKGILSIHGQKQNRIIKGTVVVKNGIIKLECAFTVPLTDHNIQVPSIVNQKIATVIDVTFKATLTQIM